MAWLAPRTNVAIDEEQTLKTVISARPRVVGQSEVKDAVVRKNVKLSI